MIYRWDNPSASIEAGHVRLFSRQTGRGWYLHTYHRLTPEYPLHRCWNFGLFAVHHVGTAAKQYGKPGWTLCLARITLKRIHGGFSLQFQKPHRHTPPQP